LPWTGSTVPLANRAALRLANKSLDELLGRTPGSCSRSCRTPWHLSRYRAAMELGEPSVLEHLSVLTGDWLGGAHLSDARRSQRLTPRYHTTARRREDEREILIAEQHRHAQFNEP